jgi:acyl-ACP thioesterase
MNNAAYWEAVEEWLAAHRDVRAPFDVVIEHLEPVTPGDQVMTVVEESATHVMIWHEVDGRLMAVTQLQR